MKFFDFFKSVYDKDKFTIKNNNINKINKNNEDNQNITNKNIKNVNIIKNIENDIEIFNKINNNKNKSVYLENNKKYILKRKSKRRKYTKQNKLSKKNSNKKMNNDNIIINNNYTQKNKISKSKKSMKLKKEAFYPTKLNRKNLYQFDNKKIQKLIKKIK